MSTSNRIGNIGANPSRLNVWATVVTALAIVAAARGGVLSAQNVDDQIIPADTCILELELPEDATVAVDGRDYGTKRRLIYRSLQPGKKYASTLEVRLPDGSRQERKVSLQGGRLVREAFQPAAEAGRMAPPSAPQLQALNDGTPELVLQTGHAQTALCAALTRDGRHLATAGLDGTLLLWDAATGHKLRSFERPVNDAEGSSRSIQSLAFSPDGRLLLSGSWDATAILWDKTTGAILREFRVGKYGRVHSVAFSPDGGRLMIGSDNEATLWEAASGKKLRTFRSRSDADVEAAAFSASGNYVVTGHNDGKTILWNAGTGAVVRSFTEERPDPAATAMDSLASSLGSTSPTSPEAMKRLNERLQTPQVTRVAISPDDTKLVTAASNGNVTLRDARTGKKLHALDVQSIGGIKSVAFSGDSRQLLCCSSSNATLWDVATGRKLRATTSPTTALGLDPGRARMLTGHQDGSVALWDTAGMKELWRVPAAPRQVSIVAFSPNGEQLVSYSMMERSVTLRSLEDGRKLREFQVPPMQLNVPAQMQQLMRSYGQNLTAQGAVLAAVFGADGRRLITGSMHMDMGSLYPSGNRSAPRQPAGSPKLTLKITVWDTATGEEVWSTETDFVGLTGGYAFALSSDRRMFLIGTPSGTTIRDLETGRELHRLPGKRYPNPIQSVAFSPDGRSLLMCSGESTATVVDLSTGETRHRLAGHRATVTCVAVSPDGRRLLTGSGDGTAILWDAATGEKVHPLEGHEEALVVVEFSPDGKRVLTSGRGNTSTLWDADSGAKLHVFPGRSSSIGYGFSFSGSFTSDSRLVSTCSLETGQCNVWNATTGESRYDSRGAAGGPIEATLGPKGEPLVVGRQPLGNLVVSNARTGGVLSSIEEHSCGLHSLSVASDSMDLLVGLAYQGGPVLWDASFERHAQLQTGVSLLGAYVSEAAISPDGQRVFTVAYGEAASVWDIASGKKLHTLEGIDQDIRCAAFSRDGKRLITGFRAKDAILWDATTGERLHVLQTEHDVTAAAFSPEGDYVLTNGLESKAAGLSARGAILWSTASGKRVREFPTQFVSCVAFAPDGERAATAGYDDTIVIWNAADGAKLRTIQVHGTPYCLEFGPDGETIVTGHDDGMATLWNVSTGEKLAAFRGHTDDIISIAFRSQGKQLLTGSRDGTVRLWETATGAELVRLIHLDGGKEWLAVTPEGLFDGSAGGRQNVMFRFGGGLNVVPVDRFFQDFYHPGLLEAIARGERPKPKINLASSLPPRVRIVGPREGGTVEAQRVTVEVETVDQGGGVRGPWLVHNGARVLVPGETEKQGRLVRRRFDVALIEGDNRLEFHAASADGSWESEPAVTTFRCNKALPKPELHLLAVGINDYADDPMDLRFSRADAVAMAELFRQRGPALYPQVHVTSLLDEEATGPAVLGAIRDVAHRARPQDTLVVFLAGHGTVVGGQYYFLPQAFRRQAPTLEEDVQRQGIWAGQIRDWMETVPALKRMLVFDTGQSGGPMGIARTARNPFAFRGAMERLSRATGTYIIAATAVSDEAKEVPELGHGVLSYALLAGLHAAEGGPLQDQWIEPSRHDRVVEALEWFGYASGHVRELTEQYFGRQQDVQHSIAGMSFPVLPVPESAEVIPVETPPPSKPVVRQEPVQVEPGVGRSKVYLVAVGINQYTEEAMNLELARRDAKAMAELFRQRGKSAYREVHANLVLDEQATKAGIVEAIEKLARQAGPEDTLAVFLAGHGRMVGQRYYFIPHEFGRRADELEDDIREQGLPADVLADAISKVPARKRILILDTCASGGALKLSRQGQDPFAFRGAIEKLGERQGVFTIAASGAGEEAQEIEKLGHGVLTYTLLAGLGAVSAGGPLEGLAIHPTSPDGRVDVLEWFSFASGHVPRLTKSYLGQAQEVHIGGRGASFPVLPVSQINIASTRGEE